jgi:hypothetical protein
MSYYESNAINQSMIKELLKNRKTFYYKYILNSYNDIESKALKDGKAFDLLITDPNNFNKEFTVLEGIKTTTKPNCITEYEYNSMLGMKQELFNHIYEDTITIEDLFKCGEFQKELYWTDEYNWLNCRAKLDWISTDKKLIIDIKTCSSIDKLYWDVINYGYDIQAAMYTRAIKQLQNIEADFVFIFVNKSPPFNVKKVKLSKEMLEEAAQKLEYGFDLYCKYKLTNEWITDDSEFLIIGKK